MNARYLIFGSLGLMLVLVGALLLIGGDPDGRDTDLPALTPAGDTAEVGGGAVRPDTLDGQAPGAGADSAGIEDGAPAGAAPADGGADGVADGVPVDGDTPVSSGAASEGTGPTSGSTRTAAAVSGASPGASPGTAGQGGGDAAPASSGPDLDAILRGLAARYEDVRSLQADFQQVIDNPLLGRRTESAGTLYQRQPDLFLMRFSDPEGDVIVSDGDYFWVYYPSVDPKQVIRSERGAQGLDLRSQFVGDPTQRFNAEYNRREEVRGRPAHVVTLVPREALGYRRLVVWIDAEDRLVRRFELTEENSNVRRFELTDLRVNPELPASLFAFDPPADAHVVRR